MTDGSGAKSMWEERYHADHYLYGTEPNGFLRANVTALPMGDVLCLAEGEGRNSVFLADTGRKVSSVDLTEAGVTKTLRLAAEHGVVVDAVAADLADDDPGEDRWDSIVSIIAHKQIWPERNLVARAAGPCPSGPGTASDRRRRPWQELARPIAPNHKERGTSAILTHLPRLEAPAK